ncbi:hypothetical protein FHS85_003172 [Rhodoligotrophos appendicifer]|uniref:DUF1488 family protein n=1 Tax=Rhodoligotrophos appendicifer TaxID=987056 RepID=UPI001478B2D1|nr:DUF1488 family protein [Rhodoligotrophos appendicifer]
MMLILKGDVTCSVTDEALSKLQSPDAFLDWLTAFAQHRATIEAAAVARFRSGLQQSGGTIVVDANDSVKAAPAARRDLRLAFLLTPFLKTDRGADMRTAC